MCLNELERNIETLHEFLTQKQEFQRRNKLHQEAGLIFLNEPQEKSSEEKLLDLEHAWDLGKISRKIPFHNERV